MASASLTRCGLLEKPSLIHHQTSPKTHKSPAFLHFIDHKTTSISKNSVSLSKDINEKLRACATKGAGSADTLDLSAINVDFVLEEVRPYLISDGGNVDVVSVEDGIISLKLQGACGSCPSSTTTMKMGIERVLKEKFGSAIKDIRQVFDEEQTGLTVEAVNRHLDILRPAITNYGGTVEVTSIDGGDCHVKYKGPDSIGSGIKAAIKEKFPDIVNVVLSS